MASIDLIYRRESGMWQPQSDEAYYLFQSDTLAKFIITETHEGASILPLEEFMRTGHEKVLRKLEGVST